MANGRRAVELGYLLRSRWRTVGQTAVQAGRDSQPHRALRQITGLRRFIFSEAEHHHWAYRLICLTVCFIEDHTREFLDDSAFEIDNDFDYAFDQWFGALFNTWHLPGYFVSIGGTDVFTDVRLWFCALSEALQLLTRSVVQLTADLFENVGAETALLDYFGAPTPPLQYPYAGPESTLPAWPDEVT